MRGACCISAGLRPIRSDRDNLKKDKKMSDDELDRIKEHLDKMVKILPSSIDVLEISDNPAISDKTRVPFMMAAYRAALIWRIRELTQCAYDLIIRNEAGASAILIRSLLETIAAIWYLKKLVKKGYSIDTKEKISKLLLGEKYKDATIEAENVLKFIDKMEKDVAGTKAIYNHLSEITHPNLAGTFLLYSDIDSENKIISFRKDHKIYGSVRKIVTKMLLALLVGFEEAYDGLTNSLPEFIRQYEDGFEKNPKFLVEEDAYELKNWLDKRLRKAN
jgi:hypothetical protein